MCHFLDCLWIIHYIFTVNCYFCPLDNMGLFLFSWMPMAHPLTIARYATVKLMGFLFSSLQTALKSWLVFIYHPQMFPCCIPILLNWGHLIMYDFWFQFHSTMLCKSLFSYGYKLKILIFSPLIVIVILLALICPYPNWKFEIFYFHILAAMHLFSMIHKI